jgi:hypothetical protein
MKRIIIVFAFLATLGTVSSCKKYLDTNPTDFASTSTYYSTQAEVDYALAGIYNILRSTAISYRWTDQANAATDESYYLNVNVQAGPASFTNISTNSISGAHWDACYQGINYANTFLAAIQKNTSLDPIKKSNAIGEALFLRGYFYFMLVQWFGGVPLHLTPAGTIADGQLARSTDKEVYDQIIKDMTDAEGLLQNQTFKSLGYAEKVTVDACQGMLARVCLHAAGAPVNDTKRYTDARTWALKLINGGQHSLVSYFPNIFIDEAKNRYNNETIWEIGFAITGAATGQNLGGPVGQNVGVRQTGAFTTPFLATDSGYCDGFLPIHPRLYRAYAPGDLRRDRTIGNYNYTVGTTTITPFFLNENQLWERYPAKWRRYEEDVVSKAIRNNSQTNFPLLRYADVLLMFAEADNEVNKGPSGDGYNAVNLVRRRAYSPTNIVNNIIALNDVATKYTSVPVITITGGGGTGATALAFLTTNQISSITVITPGNGYTSSPSVTIGIPWAASKAFAVNDQVFIANRLYNVTTAGTSTATAPTNTTGASAAATTGAVFTYSGVPATATAVLSNHLTSIDLTPSLTYGPFKQAIMDERYRELAFECVRYQDLNRWGLLYNTVRGLANDINGLVPTIPVPTATFATAAIIPVNNISPNQTLWPIPSREMLLNTKMVQNPGY